MQSTTSSYYSLLAYSNILKYYSRVLFILASRVQLLEYMHTRVAVREYAYYIMHECIRARTLEYFSTAVESSVVSRQGVSRDIVSRDSGL